MKVCIIQYSGIFILEIPINNKFHDVFGVS
jgi:hypothetical protein